MCCTNGVTTVSCGPCGCRTSMFTRVLYAFMWRWLFAEFAVLIHLRTVVGGKDE